MVDFKSISGSVHRIVERRRWTTEEGEAVLAAWEGSGLTAAEFAQQHKLKPERLERWRERKKSISRRVDRGIFEEVVRRPSAESKQVAGDFEIVLRGGQIVRVTTSFDVEALRRLLRVLDDEGGTC